MEKEVNNNSTHLWKIPYVCHSSEEKIIITGNQSSPSKIKNKKFVSKMFNRDHKKKLLIKLIINKSSI